MKGEHAMKIKARLWKRKNTEHTVEVADYLFAPDTYVASFVRCRERGLAFVETYDDGGWILWRVEILHPGPPLTLFSVIVTPEQAQAELAQAPN